jgi:hypothetical protein
VFIVSVGRNDVSQEAGNVRMEIHLSRLIVSKIVTKVTI